jgi:hypothetical protein
MGAPPGELADDLRHRRRAEILATVRAASDRLFGWQSEAGLAALVDEIASLADDLGDLCGLTGFHRERAFKPWREAWALAHLMPVTEAEAARLVPDDGRGSTPDAELRTAKGILPVEITEGISSSHDPGERPEPGIRFDGEPAQWRRNAEAVPSLLEAAAHRKVDKPYARRAVLLVYLGTGATYGIADGLIEAGVADFKARHASTFADVRVLWGRKVY